ncbi:hypothetical protein ACFYTF_28805 [Nocardia thailandica]|uniref:Uncharacterized protein n=1 Tax=Nocardia thailandica TaxID=257275 RepID=A0ABW6PWN2_9NOCA
MTTAPLCTCPPTEPRHYGPALAQVWESRTDLATFAVAVTFAAESVRAGLLGQRHRAAALRRAAETGLPRQASLAMAWERELFCLRAALSGIDAGVPPEMAARAANLADALAEGLGTLHPMLLEWHLYRHATAPSWRRRRTGQDARDYVLSLGYDPTDRHHGSRQRIRLVYIGAALGDAVGESLIVDTHTSSAPALRPERPLSVREDCILAMSADPTLLEDAWYGVPVVTAEKSTDMAKLLVSDGDRCPGRAAR